MKKAILLIALAIPSSIALNASCSDVQNLEESADMHKRGSFSKNFKDLVSVTVNVYYRDDRIQDSNSCNRKPTEKPVAPEESKIKPPAPTPEENKTKPSLHCNFTILKEVCSTPDFLLGNLGQISSINVCCEDTYAQVFTKAKAKKIAIDHAIQVVSDHTYRQKTLLNELKFGLDRLLRKDPSQVQFISIRNCISEAMAFYASVNDNYFKGLTEPLNAILDINALCKCNSKLKKAKRQIELYNAGLNSAEHRLRAFKSRDELTKRVRARLCHAIEVAETPAKAC